jgi:ACS family pantothenate transporter-like MFS transporter
MLAAWHMDATSQRVPMAILACLLQVVVGSMLLVRDLSFAGTFFAFYLAGTAYMVNPLIFGWANIILQRSGDDAVRSVTLYSMNIGSMVLWTFWGILFYSAADAPYWKKGSIALLVCCGVMFGYIWVVWKVRNTLSSSWSESGSSFFADFVATSSTSMHHRSSLPVTRS